MADPPSHAALRAALRSAVAGADLGPLAGWYGPRTVLDSYVGARQRSAQGRDAAALLWEEVVAPGGEVTHWSAACASGGCEGDVQREVPGHGAVRQLHSLHVDDGLVARHIVLPARPRLPAPLPAGTVEGVVGGAVEPLAHGGFSGARLYRARSPGGEPLVVKLVTPADDWMARATRDPGREGLLHVDGVYGRLPPRLRSPVVLAERLDSAWLVVMRDVGEQLRAAARQRGADGHRRLLEALGDLHTTFAGTAPSSSLCSVADRLRLFSPARWLIERAGCDTLPKTFLSSWEAFAERADADVAGAVLRLLDDPSGLLAELAAVAEPTLLHGDYRPGNVGVEPGGVVALDWGLACHGPAELDFVWYLSNAAWGDDEEREWLEGAWERITGTARDRRASDLAVVYHAVMGEVGYLLNATVHPPRGFPRPSPETGGWWLRRLRAALDRLGDLG